MFAEDRDVFQNVLHRGLRLNALTADERRLPGALKRLGQFVAYLLRDFLSCLKHRHQYRVDNPQLQGKKWVFISSHNNYQTLNFLLDYEEVVLVNSGQEYLNDPVREVILSFNYVPFILKKYFFLLFIYWSPKTSSKHYRQVSKQYFLKLFYSELLRVHAPECIFISNDHHPKSRALLLMAKKMDVPCYYVQHANVSANFPPLRFKASLLFGEFSEKIYRAIPGSEGDIHRVGYHRMDGLSANLNRSDRIGAIGVAFNTSDDPENVMSLVDFLADRYPSKQIISRAHPRDKRDLTFSESTHVSDPLSESSQEFLSRIDVLIAFNSSIILEAALLNIKSIYFSYGAKIAPGHYLNDYYRFVEHGLCQPADDFADVSSSIDEGRSGHLIYRRPARIYDASVESNWEFNVEQKMVDIIGDYGHRMVRRSKPAMAAEGTQ